MLHDEALAAVLETSKGRRGTLRIGTNESINLYVMPQLTEIFRQFCPDVKVEVTCAHSDALLLSLAQHRLDTALVHPGSEYADSTTYLEMGASDTALSGGDLSTGMAGLGSHHSGKTPPNIASDADECCNSDSKPLRV